MSKIRIRMFQFDFMVSRACGDQDAGTTTRGTMRKKKRRGVTRGAFVHIKYRKLLRH
jgi:hypothetical protein